MNCKEGCLAVIVRSDGDVNVGKIVRCVSFLGWGEKFTADGRMIIHGDLWEIDRYLPTARGGDTKRVSDAFMRPIRDNDGEDEMLRIAGKPREVETQ